MQPRRVVITGLGGISPLGQSIDELVLAIAENRSAVRTMAG